jgi:hypothetical protein
MTSWQEEEAWTEFVFRCIITSMVIIAIIMTGYACSDTIKANQKIIEMQSRVNDTIECISKDGKEIKIKFSEYQSNVRIEKGWLTFTDYKTNTTQMYEVKTCTVKRVY